MNRYDFYPGDYLRDTTDLSAAEDGIYLRLLNWYYSNERPVEHEARYRVTRATTSAERKAVDAMLQRFFRRESCVWVHARVEREVAKAQPRIQRSRTNGGLGGRPPKNNLVGLPHEEPSGLSGHNPSENLGETQEQTPQKPVTRARPSPSPSPEEEIPPTPQPDRFTYSFKPKPAAKREDVVRVHREWLRVFKFPPQTPLVRGWNTVDADCLAQAIDTHGVRACVAMLRYAPSDPMVSGRADDKGSRHESIAYLFGPNLPRLIRDAQTKTQGKLNGAASASEIERRKREE